MASNSTRAAASVGGFALLATAITTVILVAGGSTPAAAADLQRFSSCAEMEAWTEDVAQASNAGGDEDSAASEPLADEAGDGGAPTAAGGAAAAPSAGAAAPSPDSPATTAAAELQRDTADTADAATESAEGGDTGGTNTVVEGVDEIDVVDRLGDGRALLSRNGTLFLVDLADLEILASVAGVGYDARISVAGDLVWVASTDDTGVGAVVRRFRIDGDALAVDGEWRGPGYLMDARRTGDRFHVVLVDHPQAPGAIPFDGGPVPCEDVWHPAGGADTPAATMLVTLPAEGDLAPTAAAQVVGSGAGFHVTGNAAYVTTQTWAEDVTTAIHRFDLATLAPTGSGSVPGAVPGPFGLSEHEGNLRVATSAQPQFGVMPVEGDGGAAIDIARPAPTSGAGPLAEVFVLDTEGDLDVVGSTGRFGHDGETIHGVRFVGDTAYVVTFLQTDPFWVLDLSTPTEPRIVGELQIPGFSAYLHPVGDGHVVGFGPDGNGRVAARLFDVGDPANPSVVDELTLGDDSTVAWDHHAFVGIEEGRFAVPFSDWPDQVSERCAPAPEPLPEPQPEPLPLPVEPTTTTAVPPDSPDTPVTIEPIPVDPGIGDGSGGASPPFPGEICEPVFGGGQTGVHVIAADGDDLRIDETHDVETDGNFTAERALPDGDGGWVLLGYDRLVDPDGGELVLA